MKFLIKKSYESYWYLVDWSCFQHIYVIFISVQTGSGSTARKKNLIVNLMRSCREKEMKFLVRTLVYSKPFAF